MPVQTLNFSCTQCGKCCTFDQDDSVHFNISEIVKYGETFPLVGSFSLPNVFARGQIRPNVAELLGPGADAATIERLVEDQWQAFRRSHHVITEDGHTLGLMATAKVVTEIDGTCPKLHGKLCLIHQDRPIACKIWPVPLNATNRIGFQEALEITQGDRKGLNECDTSDAAPRLLELDGDALTIFDADIKAAVDASTAYTGETAETTRFLMTNEVFKRVSWLDALRLGQTPHFAIAYFLEIAAYQGSITHAKINRIIRAQCDLLEARITRAVSAKLSSQKTTTAMLRGILASNRDYLARYGG